MTPRKETTAGTDESADADPAPPSSSPPPPPPPPPSYRPLRRSSVRAEISLLRSAYRECEDRWTEEVEAYECHLEEEDSDREGPDSDANADGSPEGGARGAAAPQDRPGAEAGGGGRGSSSPTSEPPHEYRNHPNASGTVAHPNMFPYHDALYPLLDLYYHLETEDWASALIADAAADLTEDEGSEAEECEDEGEDDDSAQWETESEEEVTPDNYARDDAEEEEEERRRSQQQQRRSSVPSDAPTEHTSHRTGSQRNLLAALGASMTSLPLSAGGMGIVPPSPVYDTFRRAAAAPPAALEPEPEPDGGEGGEEGDDDGGDGDGGEVAEGEDGGGGDRENDQDNAEDEEEGEEEAGDDAAAQEDDAPLPPQDQVAVPPHEADVPGYMPNSAYAVYASLLPRDRARTAVWDRIDAATGRATDSDGGAGAGAGRELERAGFEFLERWEDELWTEAYGSGGGKGGGGAGEGGAEDGDEDGSGSAFRAKAKPPPKGGDDDKGGVGSEERKEEEENGNGEREREADKGGHLSPLDLYGPDRLPSSLPARADVLLRVVRHASSDLQRDHRLGRAALLLLCEMRPFEDDDAEGRGEEEGEGEEEEEEEDEGGEGGGIRRLRRLLSVLSAEYVRGCDWNCHARFLDQLTDADLLDNEDLDEDDDENGLGLRVGRPNHHCQDWRAFVHSLSTVVAHGISRVSASHATTFAAYALMEFDAASDAAAAMDSQWFEGKGGGADGADGGDGDGGGGGGDGAEADGGGGPQQQRSGRRNDRQKTMLKQNIFYFNNSSGYGQPPMAGGDDMIADGGEGAAPAGAQRADREPFRIAMVNAVVTGLGWHAVMDRARLRRLRAERGRDGSSSPSSDDDGDDGDREEAERAALLRRVRSTANSYLNCVRALVDIAENTVRRLPPNAQTMALGGRLVRCLLLSSIDSMEPGDVPHEGYVGNRVRGGFGAAGGGGAGGDEEKEGGGGGLGPLALISPTRYADAVTFASTRLRNSRGGGGPAATAGGEEADEALAVAGRILDARPPDDVRDVVRSLFVRDLVDVNVSGCGYGDFLVWTGLPVEPHDPMLFDHVSQYPDRQEEQEAGNWGLNEEEYAISGDPLAARYDFTLLMLVRAWNAPWTPRSHPSFSSHHRRAVRALALCAHRYGVPSDIATLVNAYLPRGWWPDDRRQCWCHDCQLKDVSNMIRDKVAARESGADNAEGARRPPAAAAASAKGGGAREKAPPPPPPPPTMHNLALTRLSTAADAARAAGSGSGGGSGSSSSSSAKLQTCPGCRLAMYCSNKHRKYLWQDGHKRVCGTPPFRAPGVDEELLCRDVFGAPAGDRDGDGDGGLDAEEHSVPESVGSNEDEEMDDADDDSGDWESIDTDEGDPEPVETLTKTEIIHRFFDSKAYKLQDRQYS